MSNIQDMAISIQSRLTTKFVGRQLYYYPKLTSTMEVAREKAQEGANEGTVIIADEQTLGRGRLGRTWLSPQGNLAVSIILKPSLDSLHQLIMIASLSVVHAIKQVVGIDSEIKWPNDVLVEGKKVCGILIENEVKDNTVSFAIVGIGINVNLDPLAWPEISNMATSLSYESGKEVKKDELASVLFSEFEQLYLETKSGAPIHKEWQTNMRTLGKWVQVKAGDVVEQGKAETVTECGNLILRRADGSLADIMAGDVTIIKD